MLHNERSEHRSRIEHRFERPRTLGRVSDQDISMQKVFFGSMEYLDIVNQQDEIVSKEERSLAHSKHLLHRSVHIIIANTKGEILLQLRKSTKKQYPLYWSSSVGGHVQSGETPNEAAKKELK